MHQERPAPLQQDGDGRGRDQLVWNLHERSRARLRAVIH